MLTMRLILLLTCGSLLGPISHTSAQSSPVRQPDGTNGLLSPLSGSDAIYSDAHGITHPTTVGTGLPSPGINALSGASSGVLTPLGTTPPPNRLTPAPLLPLSPKAMANPQPQQPTASGFPGRIAPPGGRPGH
ncbi:MAG: hypothetical protein JNL86_12540 [Nitrospira sp.]|nr:hypothetical protein [Nitrospira sp.]